MQVTTQLHGFLPHQTAYCDWDPRNLAACGIFSIHHAMVFLGEGDEYWKVRDRVPSLWSKLYAGLDLTELVCLGKRCGLCVEPLETRRRSSLRKFLNAHLKKGHSVVLGSEPQEHWICIGGHTEDGGYVVADSASDPAVGWFKSWDEVEAWLTIDGETGEEATLECAFEALAVMPGRKMSQGRSMVKRIGLVWEILRDYPEYAFDWSNQLNDVLGLFWDGELAPGEMDAGDFIDTHLDSLVAAVSEHTGATKDVVWDAAVGYREVAHAHHLVVPRSEMWGALARFTLQLSAKVECEG